MNELFNAAYRVCLAMIGNRDIVDIETIEDAIRNVRCMPDYRDVDEDRLRNELLSVYTTRIDTYQILQGNERREPWIREFNANKLSRWEFWTRYKQYLFDEKRFSPAVVSQLDKLTDVVLDKLFNPRREDIQIAKKGLVVGQVQSGKTANYTGLICKAADAGFNIIIVLAGIHNSLRSQTQMRIDEGFLGRDTSLGQVTGNNTIGNTIGVGNVPGYNHLVAHSYTTSQDAGGDFSATMARGAQIAFNTSEPIIFVVKKNVTVLRNLYNWLNTHAQNGVISSKSMLMIDDEADNASVNTNELNEDPTRINGLIRNIKGLFSRSAYVGYTATPFANIFISHNEDDLFPSDFIINLPAPSNYIGPEKVFGTDDAGLPIVNIVNDHTDMSVMPNSLKTALKCFIITCAVRRLRGDENKHNSMLIHASRLTREQDEITNMVRAEFEYYKQEIEAEDPAMYEELRRIYQENTPNYDSYITVSEKILNSEKFADIDNQVAVHSWDDVRQELYAAVQKIEVKAINGTSSDALTYQQYNNTGISVIAIGGDRLSRGLTLEGLSVSYFIRPARTYDTLMQMGRWFGYRPGYIDLCRLFTTSELNEWYRHITLASEELIEEFKYLAESGGTPDQYALKVRTHPGQLQVTAAGKMRNTNTVDVSWASRLIETYQLSRDRNEKDSNLNATNQLLCRLGDSEIKGNNYLWRNVSADVICDYLQQFKVPESLKKVPLDKICDYIRELQRRGECNSWSVALMSKENNVDCAYQFDNGIQVGCFVRNRAEDVDDNNTYYIRRNHILGNACDEFIDLDDNLLKDALDRTKNVKQAQGKDWDKSYPAPEIVRQEFRSRRNPLLIIYPLNPEGSNVKDKNGNIIVGTLQYTAQDTPFIGFAISFPNSESGFATQYVLNNDNV